MRLFFFSHFKKYIVSSAIPSAVLFLKILMIILISCVHHTNKYTLHSSDKQSSYIGLNHTIQNLNFFPINAERFRLSELKDLKAIVIFMRDITCPKQESLGFRIAQLEKKYSKQGILFIYNYVGIVKPGEYARKDLKKFDFKGPYLIDRKQTLINLLHAKTAEDVFILTPERQIVYKGPMEVKELAHKNKPRVKTHISDILEAMLLGKIASKEIPTSGCIIPRPHIKNSVFYRDVAPIINSKCVNCHNKKNDVPLDLSSYEEIAGRHAMIKHVIDTDLMPPWGIDPNTGPWKNDLSLTVHEKALLLRWLSTGLKNRSNKDFLSARTNRREKIIKNPDYVFKVPRITIPADGFMPLKSFYADMTFKEDRWLKEVQFITKPKIIHHFSFSFVPNQSNRKSKKTQNTKHGLCFKSQRSKDFFGCVRTGGFWNPGRPKRFDFMNAGIKLPKNSSLYVEIHYEPIGHVVIDDMSKIRFLFHKKPPKYSWKSLIIANRTIKIPPQMPNYRDEIIYTAKEDLLLAALSPHMHLRGVASSAFIADSLGDGFKKIFSTSYNFNFQSRYYFTSPVRIQKGSAIKCVNWFDNSSDNPINPDPKQIVVWGPNTENEMSGCVLSFIHPASKPPLELL